MKRIIVIVTLIGASLLAGCGGGGGSSSNGGSVTPPGQMTITSDKSTLTVTELGTANLQTVTVTTSGGLKVMDLETSSDPNVIFQIYPQSDSVVVCQLGLSAGTQSGTYTCSLYSPTNHDIRCNITLSYQAPPTDEYQIKLDVERIIIAVNNSPEPTVTSVRVWSTQPGVDLSKLDWSWTVSGISAQFHGYDWDQSAIYYIYCNSSVPGGTYRVEVGTNDLKYTSGRIEVAVMN